jgi:two-component system, LytTR family, sensor kinase
MQCILIHRCGYDWQESLMDAAISNSILCCACLLTMNTYRFYQSGINNQLYRFGWSIILAMLSSFVMHQALNIYFAENQAYLSFIRASDLFRFVYSLLMIAFVTAISWLVFYVENETENNKRKTEAENILKQAELSLLQLQLQPHFLFNSLNSISALAGSQPEKARMMIQQLSDFYRGTLKNNKEQFSTFEKELSHLQLYLEIEKVRFGNRLLTTIEYQPETLLFSMPALLLQPVMENAIKFGLYDLTGAVEISLHAKMIDQRLHIEISNPFDYETSGASSGNGFGLSSIERRLALLYGISNLLKTEKANNQFTTIIDIPLHKSTSA